MRRIRQVVRGHRTPVLLVTTSLILSMLPSHWGQQLRANVVSILPPGPHAFLHGLLSAEEDLLATRVRHLRTEITALRNQVEFLQRRGEELAVLAGAFPQVPREQRLAANVLFRRDPSPYIQSFWIDRGQAHGLRRGLAVVSGTAIVGRVLRVGPKRSLVRTVHDGEFAILARSVRTRIEGILHGTGGVHLRWRWVPREQDARIGDRLVTAGLDGKAPPGLVIGSVASVETDASGAYHEIEVIPAVDLSAIEQVVVLLTPAPPG